jgi:hypothetical protein
VFNQSVCDDIIPAGALVFVNSTYTQSAAASYATTYIGMLKLERSLAEMLVQPS